MDCLFCKIVSKEIPAFVVYEDAQVIAFLDIHPVNQGHTLVVPKVHADAITDASPDVLSAMIVVAQKVAKGLMATGAEGVNVLQNTGPVAGQVVPHLHIHVIPRRGDDGFRHWQGKDYQEGEIGTVCEQLKSHIV